MSKDNFARLEGMLGLNPAKHPSPTAELLQEVKQEFLDKRQAQAKEKATKLLEQAVELFEKATEARKQFAKQEDKFNKELGKLLGGLEGQMAPPQQQEQQEQDAAPPVPSDGTPTE